MRLNGVLFFPVTPFGADGDVAEEVLANTSAKGSSRGRRRFHRLWHRRVPRPEPRRVRPRRLRHRHDRHRPGARVRRGGRRAALRPGVRRDRRRERRRRPPAPAALPGRRPADGLVRYVPEVAAATDLPIIVYHRGNAASPRRGGRTGGHAQRDRHQGRVRRPRPAPADHSDRTADDEPRVHLLQRPAHGRDHRSRLPRPGRHALLQRGVLLRPEVALAFNKAGRGRRRLVQRLLTDFYLRWSSSATWSPDTPWAWSRPGTAARPRRGRRPCPPQRPHSGAPRPVGTPDHDRNGDRGILSERGSRSAITSGDRKPTENRTPNAGPERMSRPGDRMLYQGVSGSPRSPSGPAPAQLRRRARAVGAAHDRRARHRRRA